MFGIVEQGNGLNYNPNYNDNNGNSRNINIAEYILLSIVVITGPFIIIIFPIYLIVLYFKKVRLDRIAIIYFTGFRNI